MLIGIVAIVALVVIVVVVGMGQRQRTFGTEIKRLPYHASQRIEDSMARLRNVEQQVLELSNEQLSSAGVRTLTQIIKELVQIQRDLAEIRKARRES